MLARRVSAGCAKRSIASPGGATLTFGTAAPRSSSLSGEAFSCVGMVAIWRRKPSGLKGLNYGRRTILSELGYEVKFASEELGKGEWVERHHGGMLRDAQSAGREVLLPLAERLVVVRQHDAVRAVAHPVHGAQRGVIKRRFAQVVFQDDIRTRDPRGFAQELRDVGGVVKHIDEQADIERSIGKR